MVAGYAHPNPCEESDAFGLDDLVWELVGGADIEKCVKNPSWGDCAMAVVTITPLGKLKIIKKGADAVEDTAKGTRRGKEAIECAKEAVRDSFPAGTRVLMGDGTSRPIEQIRVGDHVLATNPETGETGSHRVDATIYTPDDRDFTSITVDEADGGGSLTATGHHPFWAENDKKWKNAADLTPEDTLRTPAGGTAQINAVRHWTGLAPAYNLTVNNLHTYYVLAGETPVLVHNSNRPLTGGFKAGVTPDEITDINRGFGGETLLSGSPANTLANASRYNSFWDKSAVVIRDIAGSHMFNNGNKRTAQAVVEELMRRNRVTSGPTSADLRSVIDRVGKGQLHDVSDISAALRGY
ncbi:intein C-terminal splicing region [Streptomyces wuyuanensis]|uniref:Intein C-terminal splicing region n=2 Tax=Streptomyces wuyuanensis TaxID=1196353 RepID=A0A1G9NX51_9ACTN|nr:intein C-terminal splicing region [Streptomyces wuyuanensis]